jgi:hypothetical protein
MGRDERRGSTYSLQREFDVWESRIGDEFGVDEVGKLCHTVGESRRRSCVVGVRVDGDRAATERRKRRLAGRACVVEAARGSGPCWCTVSHEVG